MAAPIRRTFEEIINSDTDPDDSDFEGFSSESDISVADANEYSSSESDSDDDEPVADDRWTTDFTDIRVWNET